MLSSWIVQPPVSLNSLQLCSILARGYVLLPILAAVELSLMVVLMRSTPSWLSHMHIASTLQVIQRHYASIQSTLVVRRMITRLHAV